ncbi:MAG TPA: hypothetical protein VGH87_23295 [Polyangiaceae bacterium]
MSDGTQVCSSSGALPAAETFVEPQAQSAWVFATLFLRGLAASGLTFRSGINNTLVATPASGAGVSVIFFVDASTSEVTRALVGRLTPPFHMTSYEFKKVRFNEPVGPQVFTAPIWGTNLVGVPSFTKVCP